MELLQYNFSRINIDNHWFFHFKDLVNHLVFSVSMKEIDIVNYLNYLILIKFRD